MATSNITSKNNCCSFARLGKVLLAENSHRLTDCCNDAWVTRARRPILFAGHCHSVVKDPTGCKKPLVQRLSFTRNEPTGSDPLNTSRSHNTVQEGGLTCNVAVMVSANSLVGVDWAPRGGSVNGSPLSGGCPSNGLTRKSTNPHQAAL